MNIILYLRDYAWVSCTRHSIFEFWKYNVPLPCDKHRDTIILLITVKHLNVVLRILSQTFSTHWNYDRYVTNFPMLNKLFCPDRTIGVHSCVLTTFYSWNYFNFNYACIIRIWSWDNRKENYLKNHFRRYLFKSMNANWNKNLSHLTVNW